MPATIQYFDRHKVFNTTKNEYVVYLMSMYMQVGASCVPNPGNTTMQCGYGPGPEQIYMNTFPDLVQANINTPTAGYPPIDPACYISPGAYECEAHQTFTNSGWAYQGPWYPHTDLSAGDWLSYKSGPGSCHSQSVQCWRVLAVITESEWGDQCTACADEYAANGSVGGPAQSTETCNGIPGGPCYNTLNWMGGPGSFAWPANTCPNGTPLQPNSWINYITQVCTDCTTTWNPPPVTYNCELNAQWDPTCPGCYDPGDGTGTYTGATALLDCQNAPCGCVWWDCETTTTSGGCVSSYTQSIGSYSSDTLCNTACQSWDCTCNGCEDVTSISGTSGEFSSSASCMTACTAFGCNLGGQLTNTTRLVVVYDASSMGGGNVRNAYNRVQNWLNSVNFQGEQSHTTYAGEAFLQWWNMLYLGNPDSNKTVANLYAGNPTANPQSLGQLSVGGRWGSGDAINCTIPLPCTSPGVPATCDDNCGQNTSGNAGTISHWGTRQGDYLALMKRVFANSGEPFNANHWAGFIPAGSTGDVNTGLGYVANSSRHAYGNHNGTVAANTSLTGQEVKSLPIMSVCDDVLVLYFIDEADSHYHRNAAQYTPNTGFGSTHTAWTNPTINWQNQYADFKQFWDNNLSGATNNGSLRQVIYPFGGVAIGLQKTALAGIASGNQVVPDGTWLPNTAPTTTGTVGCVPLVLGQAVPLRTGVAGLYNGTGVYATIPVNSSFEVSLEVTNPYTILPTNTYCNNAAYINYNPTPNAGLLNNWQGDVPAQQGNSWCNVRGLNHYGFLDQMGWGYNPSINANANQIATDVSQYLTAGTNTQTGTCISAHTLADPGSLYPFQTLEECTGGCATYDCGDNGCIMDPSGGGAFNTLASCTASCSSYECSDTGCTLWNGVLGGGSGGTWYDIVTSNALMACTATCFSWDCDGIGNCQLYPGTASTFTTEAECLLSCVTWECGILGCSAGPNGAFTSQTECDAVCFSWGCGNLGCEWVSGTTGAFTSQTECDLASGSTGCTSYNCQWNGCVQVTGTLGYYTFLEDCEIECTSFECTSGGCIEQTGNTGTFPTSAACDEVCISYSCVTTGCTDLIGTGLTNTWLSDAWCEAVCISYDCTDYGCIDVGAVSGSGGTFSSLINCETACTSYNCGGGGCYEWNTPGTGGSGGTYTSMTECYDSGCTSWNCSDDGCVEISGTSGQYLTQPACTASCISYNCTDTGCTTQQGSGGTYLDAVDCGWYCTSWDCTDTGCVNVSALSGSGGTYSSLLNCEVACTSFDCTDNGCIDVGVMSGTGGTFTYETGCTATCVSYNCTDYGCPEQPGTGGTYTASGTCTAACQSYECTTGGCQEYNQPYMGTGGTIELSACTGSCIAWSCGDNQDLTVTDIYAFYDTTSMGLAEVEDAMFGMEDWVATIPNYQGTLRHGLYNDERWLEWAASVFNDERPAGNSTPTQNMIAGLIHKAAIDNSWSFQSRIYDNCVVGTPFPLIFTNSWVQVNARGPVPTATTNSDVLTVCFIDESGPNNGLGNALVYTSNDPGPNSNIPQFSGITASILDQPTDTWKEDYTAFTQQYNIISAGTGTANFFLYPTDSYTTLPNNKIFALHGLASISSGNKTIQDGMWLGGTAPRTTASGGAINSIPPLCNIADLITLESVNPYFAEGYGALDRNGWGINPSFLPFTRQGFGLDLDLYLESTPLTTGTTCVSAATYPYYPNWPHASLDACTGECSNYVCQADNSASSDGCVLTYPGIVSPPGFDTLSACTASCISYNCITTGCTSQVGTGGTYSNSFNCDSNCNSWNCESWQQQYGPQQTWNGCLPQNGTGGTYSAFTSCTDECLSFECTASCETLAAGCDQWSNTGGTYVTLSACTGSCEIEWYCIMAEEINSCENQIILGPGGNVINNGYHAVSPANISTGYGALGWFADNDQSATWSNHSFSMPVNTSPINNNHCEGPAIATNMGGTIPGYLSILNSITFTPTGNYSLSITWPRTYTSWSSLITDFQSIGSPVNSTMDAFNVFQIIRGVNNLWDGLDVSYDVTPCYCDVLPCDVFCHDGNLPIPTGAQGPYTTSAAAETVCCTANTWFCSASTVVSSCSGTTTIPGTYNTNIDAWNYISTTIPTINLNTLSYESTTPANPAINECEGPNGNRLYEILPISYHLLSANTSFDTWNEFVDVLILSGVTGIYPGIQFSILDGYLEVQSGHTLVACAEPCNCITTDCACYEMNSTSGYTTQAECLSACCPVSAYTATSWNCLSGNTIVNPNTGAITQEIENICPTKNYLGIFIDTYHIIDWHRIFQPTGIMALNKECIFYDDFGSYLPGYTWPMVNAIMSASTSTWEDCFQMSVELTPPITTYRPYMYVERIGHPAVNSNLGYSSWGAFYNAASALWPTLTTNMEFTGVCAELAAQSGIGGAGGFSDSDTYSGCNWTTRNCCLHRGCDCYETFDTTGQYLTDTLCESACCPTTGWTCEALIGCFPIVNYTGLYYPASNVHQYESNCIFYCDPPLSGWNCVSAFTVDSCSASTVITAATPNIAINNITYPFTSSTLYNTGYYQAPTTSTGFAGLDYMGMPGQVEALLTNITYYPSTDPFSGITFELTTASTTWNGFSNSPCSGDNGYNTYRLTGLGHLNVQGGLLFNTWGGFVTMAQSQGYMVTSSMNVIDVSNMVTVLAPLYLSGWTYNYENCECTIMPCHCEMVVSPDPFTYASLSECELDCCLPTYNCNINGCYDPLDGSGSFIGLTAQQDCENLCFEWWCQTATTVTDSCSGVYVNGTFINETRAVFPEPQPQSNFSEYCPYGTGHTTMFPGGVGSPVNMGGINEYSVLMDFGNPSGPDYANPPLWGGNMQNTIFNTIKWLDTSPTNQITDSCPCIDTVPAPCTVPGQTNCVQTCQSGYFSKLSHVVVFSGCDIQYDQVTGAQINYPNPMSSLAYTPIQPNGVTGFTSWSEMILALQFGGLPVSLTQTPDVVSMVLSQASTAGLGTENLYLMPYKEHCTCMTTECECVVIDGTGHTSTALTYYDSTAYTNCELACCSGVTLEVCDVLIVGRYEGVCKYDVANNIVTKLFDIPNANFEEYDIATRQNLLWLYDDITDVIKEYTIFWYGVTFSHMFNRDIFLPSGYLGKGMTATEVPFRLLVGGDAVYEVDVTSSVVTAGDINTLFMIPSGLTCTGDILYEKSTVIPLIIVTYGNGVDQYVGKFTYTGIKLEESHINATTNLDVGETFDALFSWDPLASVVPAPVPYSSLLWPLYGITTNKRVYVLQQSPLEFAPAASNTLSLVNQIADKVNGASNLTFIDSSNPVNIVYQGCHTIEEPQTLWWCTNLGCISNLTQPPNSVGSWFTQSDCEDHCNFVCGDCAGGCSCIMINTLTSPSCNPQPTMGDCILQNITTNTTVINGGDTCCDCHGCLSVTFWEWNYSFSNWISITIPTTTTNSTVVQPWVPGYYTIGSVVLFTDPYGNECCYTIVSNHYNTNMTPYDAWQNYLDAYNSNTPMNTGNGVWWIACDPDCATIITWDCNDGGHHSCQGLLYWNGTAWTTQESANVLVALSFTAHISNIIVQNAQWSTLGTLGWEMGGGVAPLNACPGHMGLGFLARIISVTHQTLPTTYTTWASFIDAVNIQHPGWNVSYTANYQDVDDLYGQEGMVCNYQFCICDDIIPAFTYDSCDMKTLLPPAVVGTYTSIEYFQSPITTPIGIGNSNNMRDATFSNYSYFGQSQLLTNQCSYGNTGYYTEYIDRIDVIHTNPVNGYLAPNFAASTTWNSFISQIMSCTVGNPPLNTVVDINSTFAEISSALQQVTKFKAIIVNSACTCVAAPCECIPIIGPSGQYTTSAACSADCCDTSWKCITGSTSGGGPSPGSPNLASLTNMEFVDVSTLPHWDPANTSNPYSNAWTVNGYGSLTSFKHEVVMDWVSIHHPNTDVSTLKYIAPANNPNYCTGDSQYSDCCQTEPYYPNDSAWRWAQFLDYRMGATNPSQVTLCNPAQQIFTKYSDFLAWAMTWMPGAFGISIPATVSYSELFHLVLGSTNCNPAAWYQTALIAPGCSPVVIEPCECIECNHPPNAICPYTSKTECEGTNMTNNSCDNKILIYNGVITSSPYVDTIQEMFSNTSSNQNDIFHDYTFQLWGSPAIQSHYNLTAWPTDGCTGSTSPSSTYPVYDCYIESLTVVDTLGLSGPAGAVIDGPYNTNWFDFIIGIQGASWCTNCYLATFSSTLVDIQALVANNHMDLVINWEFCQCVTTPVCCPDITWNCETGVTTTNSCDFDVTGQLEIYAPSNPNGAGLDNYPPALSPTIYVTSVVTGLLVQGGGPYIYVGGVESVKYMMDSLNGAQSIPFSSRTFYHQSQLAPYTAPGQCMAPITEYHPTSTGAGMWSATIDYVTDIQLDICPNNHIPGPQLPIIGVSSNDFIQNLISQGIAGITPSSTYDQVRTIVIETCTQFLTGYPNTDEEWISKWVTVNTEPCQCASTNPCGCVPVYDGSGQYLTQPECEVDCECVTWNCTPNGCVDPLNGTGTFTGLTDCQLVCQEYECQPEVQTPMAGPYDCSGLPTLPLSGPSIALLNYYGEPTTTPIFPNMVNMQNAQISDFKYDCTNCSVTNPNMCDSPNGKWFKGWKITAHMTGGNPPTTTLMGAYDTWADMINDMINVWNVTTTFGFGLSWSVSQITNCLQNPICSGLGNPVTLGMEMDPCYCNTSDCDCVLVPGTGNTGYDMSMYNSCTGACCSAESRYDCSINGCYDTLNGIGEFASLAACTADCREWKCISGTTPPHNWVDCSLKTGIPVIIQNNNYSNSIGAGPTHNEIISYMADSANGLQTMPFSSYKVMNDTQYPSATDQCIGNIVFFGTVYYSYSRNLTTTDGVNLPNAPYYNSWSDLISDCQSVGIAVSLINTPLQVQAMIGAYYNVPAASTMYSRQSPCHCMESNCYCLELPNTGNTGNIYTTYNACNIAVNNKPCCTTGSPIENNWICDTHTTPPYNECTCVDMGPGYPGTYATLAECKDAPNCCDDNYYDCWDGGCVGLANGIWGPYQTAQDCYNNCTSDGWNCNDDGIPGPAPINPCTYCPVGPCQYNNMTAAGFPYFGNSQQQCVDTCGKDCWKCCMGPGGWIYQLFLSAVPCECPDGDIEVPCDGDGPCPHPVSCIPPLTYSWVLCKCVCEPNMSCAPGYHWSYDLCTCVKDRIIIHDFRGPIENVIFDISESTGRPLPQVVTDVNTAVRRLENLMHSGFKGDHCPSCDIPGKKNSNGVCLYDGCLNFKGNKKDRQVNLEVIFPNTVTPGTPISPGVPGIGGCSLIKYQATCLDNTVVDATILTSDCGLIDGVPPTVEKNLHTWVRVEGDSRVFKVVRIIENAQQQFSVIDKTFTTTTCGLVPINPINPINPVNPVNPVRPTVGYNCIESGNSTKCVEYGSPEYIRLFGTNPPTYPTLELCTVAGCGTPPAPEPPVSKVRYMCTQQLNRVVNEYQNACVPTTQIPEGVISYDSIGGCINSGCGGWFNCNSDQALFGTFEPKNTTYPIPMCCESTIKRQTDRLTYVNCVTSCLELGATEPWFPLYNVDGPNTTKDSPLAYMERQLVNPVIEGLCSVSNDLTTYKNKGFTTNYTYKKISVPPVIKNSQTWEWWQCNHLANAPDCFCEPCPYVNGQQELDMFTYGSMYLGVDDSACIYNSNCCDAPVDSWFCTQSNGNCTLGTGPGGFVTQAACVLFCNQTPDIWVCTQGACILNPTSNYPLVNQYATQQDCLSSCNLTTWVCKCLPLACSSPVGPGHQHECEARSDGSGYLNSLQECLDFCPCEITTAKDVVSTVINYDIVKLDACPGHTDRVILPAHCMSEEYSEPRG